MTLRELLELAVLQDESSSPIDLDEAGEWLHERTGSELGDLILAAERLIRAARAVKTRVEYALLEDVMRGGAIRVGDRGYYAGEKRMRRLVDPDGLLAWVRHVGGDRMIGKAFRLEPRIRVLQGLAADEDVEWRSVEGTFFEWEGDGELALQSTRDAAWMRDVEDGGRRRT